MILFRELVAILSFALGVIGMFAWDSVSNKFGLVLLVVVCFSAAYFIWPSHRRGQREEGSLLEVVLECMVELPVELLKWVLRLIARLFNRADGGFDIDV